MAASHRIAVIPGDGIGKEVVPEGVKVLETVSSRFDISFAFENFDWSCERYLETGSMMPADGIEQLSGLILAEGAIPMVPVIPGPRSDKISPNRFEPTTTSNISGRLTKCETSISM